MSTKHDIQINGISVNDEGDHIIKLDAFDKYSIYARRNTYDTFYNVYINSIYKGTVQDTTPSEVMENIIKFIYI